MIAEFLEHLTFSVNLYAYQETSENQRFHLDFLLNIQSQSKKFSRVKHVVGSYQIKLKFGRKNKKLWYFNLRLVYK